MKALHSTHASAKGSFDNIAMNGQEVFKFAVRAVPTVLKRLSHAKTRAGVKQMSVSGRCACRSCTSKIHFVGNACL